MKVLKIIVSSILYSHEVYKSEVGADKNSAADFLPLPVSM